jgi:hypothetical protein
MKKKTFYGLTFTALVALVLYVIFDPGTKGDVVKGIVHNPNLPLENAASDTSAIYSTSKVGVVQILESADGLFAGELILYYNKNKEELRHGDTITIEVKKDRIASTLGIGGTPIRYGAFKKKG